LELLDKKKVIFNNHHSGVAKIIATFSNLEQFLYAWNMAGESANFASVLSEYEGLVEIELENQLLYKLEINYDDALNASTTYEMDIEVITIPDTYHRSDSSVIKREHFSFSGNGSYVTIAENIRSVRWYNSKGCTIPIFTYYTYENLFNKCQTESLWEHLGDFSLSLTNNEVFSWLLGEPYSFLPHLDWLKYNDGMLLSTENYIDRWTHADDGLKLLVQDFVNNSITDPKSYINLAPEDTEDPNTLTVSQLDMLRLVATDYHAARMLGLGLLDGQPAASGPSFTQYIYAAVYTTKASLPVTPLAADHIFITLPTSCTDYRLPLAPTLQPLTYGLYVDTDGSGQPVKLSDNNGYSYYDDVRFVNLSRIANGLPQPLLPSIPANAYFDASATTQPVAYGIKYKASGQLEWEVPELLHDDVYEDPFGYPETVFTPETELPILYSHKETLTGAHDYALYAINWFSRASSLSETQSTDVTAFPKRLRLLPPANIGVQYIQEEDPLIFTTSSEQAALNALEISNPGEDNCKTRLVFEWNEVHNGAYRSADKVTVHYRENTPLKVEGLINSITAINAEESLITTTFYVVTSVSPAFTVSPAIPPALIPAFTGSYLSTPDGQFKILEIISSGSGTNPTIRIQHIASLQAVQTVANDPYTTMPIFLKPKPKDVFYINENLNRADAWTKLSREVPLIQLSNATETIYEPDGSSHVDFVGGAYSTAFVTAITETLTDPVTGDPYDVPTGGYLIYFDNNYALPAHSDPSVTWTRGSVRLALSGSNLKRSLPVASIEFLSPLVIIVYDPQFNDPSVPEVLTGSGLMVNYHPSYKVYLSPEPTVFNRNSIMPQPGQNNKKTYLSLRSVDSTNGNTSDFSTPVTLVARNIQKPLPPEAILSAAFTTRPDFYGKSSYTLDIKLNTTDRTPYGVMVYRATEMAILQALYTNTTIQEILDSLQAIAADDPYKFNRWISLINAEYDPALPAEFKQFGEFRFPQPDNTETIAFTQSAEEYIHPFPLTGGISNNVSLVKQVIEDIFIPLSQVPVILDYVKTGTQTAAMPPKTHDLAGKLLNPLDPSFNPFPMAVKFPEANPDHVRFTDYSIIGNANNIFFYFAKEVSMDTKMSQRSAIAGPVSTVDAKPPLPPKIRKVVANEQTILPGQLANISFEVADYLPSEGIKAYRIYRSYTVANATTVKTMKLAAEIPVADPLVDAFADLQFPPFGNTLFYRIVALRGIVNEHGQSELVPSEPSEMVMSSIMDVLNPEAPAITYQNTTDVSGNLTNVVLSWPTTTFNGTYYVYKMNSKGNWEMLYNIKSNKTTLDFPDNGDFANYPVMSLLPKTDDDGNTIYHRFKVNVENASGLFNLQSNDIVL
jgi:hypothetical protein